MSPPTLHRRTGVRKQFLITGGKTIFGFVAKKGGKFGNCPCATDITAAANCKVHLGLNIIHTLLVPDRPVGGYSEELPEVTRAEEGEGFPMPVD